MRQFWRMLLRNPGGLIGLVILAITIAVAVFGPLLFPASPWRMVQRPFLPPFTMARGFPECEKPVSPLGAFMEIMESP